MMAASNKVVRICLALLVLIIATTAMAADLKVSLNHPYSPHQSTFVQFRVEIDFAYWAGTRQMKMAFDTAGFEFDPKFLGLLETFYDSSFRKQDSTPIFDMKKDGFSIESNWGPPSDATVAYFLFTLPIHPQTLQFVQVLSTTRITSEDGSKSQDLGDISITFEAAKPMAGRFDTVLPWIPNDQDDKLRDKSIEFTLTNLMINFQEDFTGQSVVVETNIDAGQSGAFDRVLFQTPTKTATPTCIINGQEDKPVHPTILSTTQISFPVEYFTGLDAVVKCDPATLVLHHNTLPFTMSYVLSAHLAMANLSKTYLAFSIIAPSQPAKAVVEPFLATDKALTLSFELDTSYWTPLPPQSALIALDNIALPTGTKFLVKATTIHKDEGVVGKVITEVPMGEKIDEIAIDNIKFENYRSAFSAEYRLIMTITANVAAIPENGRFGIKSGSRFVHSELRYRQLIQPSSHHRLQSFGQLVPKSTILKHDTNLHKAVDFTIERGLLDEKMNFRNQLLSLSTSTPGVHFHFFTDKPRCYLDKETLTVNDATGGKNTNVIQVPSELFVKNGGQEKKMQLHCEVTDIVIDYGLNKLNKTETVFSTVLNNAEETDGYFSRVVETSNSNKDDPKKKPNHVIRYLLVALVLIAALATGIYFLKKFQLLCFKNESKNNDENLLGDDQGVYNNLV